MVLTTLKLCFGLMLLVTVIHGNIEVLIKKLNKMAKKGTAIDDMFVPLENGFINQGAFGFVFKGTRVADHRSVALKFVSIQNRMETDREFEIYSYLNAINNTNVEQYGFSPIYYYQEWNGYMLMVYSYFGGGDLVDIANAGYFGCRNETKAINSLILFRNFVLHSKYMHRHGVRHDDIKPENLMIHNGRSFLIDFNGSSKMKDRSIGGTLHYLSRSFYCNQIRGPKDDWESFLYTMACINNIELGWLNHDPFAGLNATEAFVSLGQLKSETNKTIANIESATIASHQLRSVFLEFARETFNDSNSVPNYDRLYAFIADQIDELITPHRNALFTWIRDNEKEAAMHDLEQASFDIAAIPNPWDNYNLFPYPEYSLDFFSKPILKKRSRLNVLSCFGGSTK